MEPYYKKPFRYSIIAPFVARHDVSLKPVEKIREEVNSKYKDSKELADFIIKRFFPRNNYYGWHLSPLGLVWTEGDYFNHQFKGQSLYSARHVVESLYEEYPEEEVKGLVYDLIKENANFEIPELKKRKIDGNVILKVEASKDLNYFNFEKDNQEVYYFQHPEKIGLYVIWDGVSREATHQLVRHQSFDYQQQSQRYINFLKKEKMKMNFYVPNSLIYDDNYAKQIMISMKNYANAVKNKIKLEDARFYLPFSTSSRIVIFIPFERCCGRDGIKEFIEKRKYGQEEIKNFALTLEEILKEL